VPIYKYQKFRYRSGHLFSSRAVALRAVAGGEEEAGEAGEAGEAEAEGAGVE